MIIAAQIFMAAWILFQLFVTIRSSAREKRSADAVQLAVLAVVVAAVQILALAVGGFWSAS